MTFKSIKKIWKEHKKEIIFAGLLGIAGGVSIKAEIDNKKTVRMINAIQKTDAEYDGKNYKAIKEDLNYLATKIGLTEDDWNFETEPDTKFVDIHY